MSEVWKDVVGFEGSYQVSNEGRIRSVARKVFSQYRNGKPIYRSVQERVRALSGDRYLCCSIIKNGKMMNLHPHVEVLRAFVGERPSPDHVARHRDNDTRNNRLDNLRWGTQKENMEDKILHGTRQAGERGNGALLTNEQAAEIRKITGKTGRQIAKEYGVSENIVSRIRRGKIYRELL